MNNEFSYQIVFIRGDEQRVVARFASLTEAQNTIGIYKTAMGRYEIRRIDQ